MGAGAARAQAPAVPGKPPFEASYRAVYIGEGRLSEGGRESGKVSGLQQDWRIEARRPLGEGRLTLGAFYRRTDLAVGSSEPIPDTLQLFRASLGYERALTAGWRGAAQLAPSFAGDRRVDARGFSLAGSLIATSSGDRRRTWVVGLGVDPQGPIPVLPFFGAILRPNDDWTVRLLLPDVSVARRTGELLGAKSEAKVGLRLGGGGYRVSPSFGSARGRPELDGAWLKELTVGAETGLTLDWAHMRAEVTAGWAFMRRFEYRDAGVRLKAAGAPIVGLTLSGRL